MISMWKIRELTDKVTNVVMNYSEVETKVREATNDDAWGPHGQLMKEIAQYTFTYEHFPEVMGMLWKRMFHENKKNWRRVYNRCCCCLPGEKRVAACGEKLVAVCGEKLAAACGDPSNQSGVDFCSRCCCCLPGEKRVAACGENQCVVDFCSRCCCQPGEKLVAACGDKRVGACGEKRVGACGEKRVAACGENQCGVDFCSRCCCQLGEKLVAACGDKQVGACGEKRIGACGEKRVAACGENQCGVDFCSRCCCQPGEKLVAACGDKQVGACGEKRVGACGEKRVAACGEKLVEACDLSNQCGVDFFQSLLLLSYLVKNGSERVVTSAREHIYDLRGLENYSFSDENGKDQGVNVRHKVKELLGFVQDDERLRDERKKAKKNKDKFVGVSSDIGGSSGGGGGGGYRYSDRYDDEPKRSRGDMNEIEDWSDGKKSVVGEVVDKAKDLWNRASGRRGPDKYDHEDDDDFKEYRGGKDRDDWDRGDRSRSRDPDSDLNDHSDRGNRGRQFKDEFRDKDEYTSVEQTQTTRTEKIVTNRRTRSVGKKLDLGAAASALGVEGDATGESGAPSLIDMGPGGQNSGSDFADFTAFPGNQSSTGDDFDPREMAGGQVSSDFGDFAQFQSSNATSPTGSQGGFADFSQFSAASNSTSAPLASAGQQSMTQAAPGGGSGGDLFDVFATPTAANSGMSMNMTSTSQVSMTAGMNMPMMGGPVGMGMQGAMPMQANMAPGMSQNGGMVMPGLMTSMAPMTPMTPAANTGWSMTPQTTPAAAIKASSAETVGDDSSVATPKKLMPSTWSDTKVDISVDGLSPSGRGSNKPNTPSMNQMQVKPSPSHTGNQGMMAAQTSVPSGAANQAMMGSGMAPCMMGGQLGMMGSPGMMAGQGMQPGMMGGQVMMGTPGMQPAGMMGTPGMQPAGMMGTPGMPQAVMMGNPGMMGGGMAGLNQGMAGMSLQGAGGGMNMMGPRPGMVQPMGYGMGMMGGPMNGGMMGAQSASATPSSFQKRTDQAFSSLGNMKQ